MTADVLTVQGLCKTHAGHVGRVLDDVSFSVPAGRIVVVMGKSGAGKTTLLRCLTGLEAFEEGTVTVDGRTVQGFSRSSRKEHQRAQHVLHGLIGMVFQSYELFPHLSVLHNCTLAPVKVRHVSPSDAEARARQVLTGLGLGDKAAAWPDSLSGGQKQRVAIARALCMEPRVLFFDEPTSALDPATRRDVGDLLLRLKETGITQVVVAHDEELARQAADVVLEMEAGRLKTRTTV